MSGRGTIVRQARAQQGSRQPKRALSDQHPRVERSDPSPSGAPFGQTLLESLQRSVGNRAVTGMLERDHAAGPQSDAPAEAERSPRGAPPTAAVLAAQQSVGNRAVVQRLAWNANDGTLVVPTAYANQQVPWDGQYTEDRQPTGADKTFYTLAKDDYAFRAAVANGLEVDFVSAVKHSSNEDLQAKFSPGMVKKKKGELTEEELAAYNQTVREVASTTTSNNAVLKAAARFENRDAVVAARHLVPDAKDYLPQAPDLPEVGVDVFSQIPEKDEHTYWEYVCVLIALYKADGIDKVKQVTGKDKLTNKVGTAVQALHDYFVGKDIQYDDGAGEIQVMKEFGYRRIFAGRANWDKLAVTLAPGTYIFDIEGHTVKVRVLQQIAPDTVIGRLADYFEPDSDKNNYNTSEFLKPVTSIWKK